MSSGTFYTYTKYNEERNVVLNLHLDKKLWFLKVSKA